jgi:hypothetical protein
MESAHPAASVRAKTMPNIIIKTLIEVRRK